MKNVLKGAAENMEVYRGDIFEYESDNGTGGKIVIVSADYHNNGNIVSAVSLQESSNNNDCVRVLCGGEMWANPYKLGYMPVKKLTKYMRTASDEEMNNIGRAITKALDLPVETILDNRQETVNGDNRNVCAEVEARIYKELYENLLAKVMK